MKRRLFMLCSVLMMAAAALFSVSVTQAQTFGVNWSGTFYPTNNLSGTGVPVAGINGLNFNWGAGVPIVNGVAVPGIPADSFSARFTSVQDFAAGTYTFTVSSDDGVRVFIDGLLLLDRFIGRSLTTDTFSATLTAGPHTLTVEYFDNTDAAVLQVQWGLSGGGGIIPTGTAFFGPTGTPAPTATPAPTGLPAIPGGALTATVIRAPVLNARGAPSVFSERVGRLLRGQTYQVIGRDPDARWFLLQLSGFQGWALGYYLAFNTNEFNAPVVSDFVLGGNPAATATGTVGLSRATLRLRAAPTVSSAQIGRVTWGGTLAVVGRTARNDWYQVVWKGTTGWVASAWVDIVEGSLADVPVVQ